jgi:hypothetical protein
VKEAQLACKCIDSVNTELFPISSSDKVSKFYCALLPLQIGKVLKRSAVGKCIDTQIRYLQQLFPMFRIRIQFECALSPLQTILLWSTLSVVNRVLSYNKRSATAAHPPPQWVFNWKYRVLQTIISYGWEWQGNFWILRKLCKLPCKSIRCLPATLETNANLFQYHVSSLVLAIYRSKHRFHIVKILLERISHEWK